MVSCSWSRSPQWVRVPFSPTVSEVRASLMKHARSLALLLSVGVAVGCVGVKSNASNTGSGGGSGATTGSGGAGASKGGGSGGSINPPPSSCNGQCDDFGGGPFGPDGT